MARTPKFKVRTVRTKEDRRRPSVFMRLKTDEAFKGIALFEPDPELDDNPGYLEYYDHYDKQANQYVPCAGENCPFCAANDNPSTRALTTWFFPEAADKADQLKVFTMNYGTINEITDESEDEDGILGKAVRVKRLSDKGDYRVKLMADKPLAKTALKEAMGLLDEKFPDGLEAVVERQLVAQMERLKAMEALEDDDDDEDDDDVTDEAEEDEEEEDDEEEAEEDDEEEAEEEEAEEEDEEEAEEDEDAEEAEEDIVGGEYVISKVNEKDEIFELQSDDGTIKMWLGEGVDVDYEEAKPKATVAVNATTDDEGDLIITEFSVIKKARKQRTTTKSATAKRGTTRKTTTKRTTRSK